MRHLLTPLAALFTTFSALCSEPLTLRQAAELMAAHNHRIASDRLAIEAAESARRSKIGLFIPQIELNSTFLHAQKSLSVDFNPLKPLLSNLPIPELAPLTALDWRYTIQPRTFAVFEADIVAPLFTGGKILAANRAAQLNLLSTQAAARATRLATLSELISRYFACTLSASVIDVRRAVVRTFEKHLEDVNNLIDNGLATKADKLFVEYRLSEARADLRHAELLSTTTEAALTTTIGLDSVRRATTPLFILTSLESLDHFTASARQSNPELDLARHQLSLAGVGVAAARADFFPTIAAFAGGGLTKNVTDILPRWAVGISLNFKLFNGLEREWKYLAARKENLRAERMFEWAESNIDLKTQSLYNTTTSHLIRTLSLYDSIAFARQILENRHEAFLEGLATSTELLDAATELAASQTEQLEAAYNFIVSFAQLLECAGRSESFFDYAESLNRQIIAYENY